MIVYVLLGIYDHEGAKVLGVYKTQARANEEAERYEQNKTPVRMFYDWYEVEPHVLES